MRWVAVMFTAGLLTLGVGNANAACVGGSENGQVQAGEQCDDGPGNTCCTSNCTIDATQKDVACDDHNDCSELSSCNNLGQCIGRKPNDGDPCFLYDGVGGRIDCITRTCEGLSCTGTVQFDPCDDGNACTYDNGTYAPAEPNECLCGSHVPLVNGTICDTDSDQCTIEKCFSGLCQLQSTLVCEQPNNPCRRKRCDAASGTCKAEDKPNGTACPGDGKTCTTDECKNGTCVHPYLQSGDPCDDNRYCTANDGCYGTSPWTGQAATNQLDCFGNPFQMWSLPCNDGNACSSESTCDNAGNCNASVCATTGVCNVCQVSCDNSDANCNCAPTLNGAP